MIRKGESRDRRGHKNIGPGWGWRVKVTASNDDSVATTLIEHVKPYNQHVISKHFQFRHKFLAFRAQLKREPGLYLRQTFYLKCSAASLCCVNLLLLLFAVVINSTPPLLLHKSASSSSGGIVSLSRMLFSNTATSSVEFHEQRLNNEKKTKQKNSKHY